MAHSRNGPIINILTPRRNPRYNIPMMKGGVNTTKMTNVTTSNDIIEERGGKFHCKRCGKEFNLTLSFNIHDDYCRKYNGGQDVEKKWDKVEKEKSEKNRDDREDKEGVKAQVEDLDFIEIDRKEFEGRS